MKFLKKGSSGPEVLLLQKRLKFLYFNPGPIDGIFGPATEAALLSFQKSQNMLSDGIAGPQTYTALDLAEDKEIQNTIEKSNYFNVIPKIDYRLVSKIFPVTPVSNIKENLPYILNALKEFELKDKNIVVLAFATIRAETEGFEPISEFKSIFNTSPNGHPFDLYDYRRDLGNQGPPDGDKFKGRGYIQITGRFNYKRCSEQLGLGNDLEKNPELANDKDIASKILALYLKNNEKSLKQAVLDNNIKYARKIINGGTYGIDRFRDAYRIGKILL